MLSPAEQASDIHSQHDVFAVIACAISYSEQEVDVAH